LYRLGCIIFTKSLKKFKSIRLTFLQVTGFFIRSTDSENTADKTFALLEE